MFQCVQMWRVEPREHLQVSSSGARASNWPEVPGIYLLVSATPTHTHPVCSGIKPHYVWPFYIVSGEHISPHACGARGVTGETFGPLNLNFR